MDKDTLLYHAKTNYIEGIKFKSAFSGGRYSINKSSNFTIDREGDVRYEGILARPVIYRKRNKKWAEILNKIIPKELTYEIY